MAASAQVLSRSDHEPHFSRSPSGSVGRKHPNVGITRSTSAPDLAGDLRVIEPMDLAAHARSSAPPTVYSEHQRDVAAKIADMIKERAAESGARASGVVRPVPRRMGWAACENPFAGLSRSASPLIQYNFEAARRQQREDLLHEVGCVDLASLDQADPKQLLGVRNVCCQLMAARPYRTLEEVPSWRYVDEREHYVKPTFILNFSSAKGIAPFFARMRDSKYLTCKLEDNHAIHVRPKFGISVDQVKGELERCFQGFADKQVGSRIHFDAPEDVQLGRMFPSVFNQDATLSLLDACGSDKLERLLRIFNERTPRPGKP